MATHRVPAAALLVLPPVACSSDPQPDAASHKVVVTVVLTDAPPLAVLFNRDDSECSSQNLTGGFTRLADMPVEIALRDASGAVVGTQELPRYGGTFTDGCSWPVEFSAPVSDFYEATVTAPGGQGKSSGATKDGAAEITVAF